MAPRVYTSKVVPVFLCLLLLGIAEMAIAQVPPLLSAAWGGVTASCSGADQLMPLDGSFRWDTQNSPPGAGIWPTGRNLIVRKVCIRHMVSAPGFNDYAVAGHSGPNGDHVTPYAQSNGPAACMSYDGSPVVVTGGEYFDVHASCSVGGVHSVILQIWYEKP